MFCNAQDIEVKVQYILHEDGSRVLPTPPRPLCLQAQKNREVAHMLFGLSDLQFFFFFNHINRSLFSAWSDIAFKKEFVSVFDGD